MYKLDLPVDLKEASVRERRKNVELQRQSRVFNSKARIIGVDKEALDTQVNDCNILKQNEKQRQELYAKQMLQNDQIACLLDERQKEDILRLNKAVADFQQCFQKREDRREFDLYDPQGLKKELPARISDKDPRCTVSGVQQLLGEDINQPQRQKFQQEQFREWSLQQQKEFDKARVEKKCADDLYDKTRIELDQRAMELQRMEEETRRLVCMTTKEFNMAQAMESFERKRIEKQHEEEDNIVEISNLLQGDLLSENPEQAASAFGPHRVVPDRWKGMSEEQLMEIKMTQEQQIHEKMRLQEEERQRAADWDRQRVQAARAMVLAERQQKRQEKELRKAQDHVNMQLAQAHKAQKAYLDKEVFSNAPTDEYFSQFNTTSR
ncbi:RIB43A-like with coiled-coils protein 2 [Ambystoma mexicanum]|uniref:RIB43A-like with coiled-coils protein 2 n=1 Tax=Ambystoma mexicanum TaxID=8296 RepID=UPI0037E911F6